MVCCSSALISKKTRNWQTATLAEDSSLFAQALMIVRKRKGSIQNVLVVRITVVCEGLPTDHSSEWNAHVGLPQGLTAANTSVTALLSRRRRIKMGPILNPLKRKRVVRTGVRFCCFYHVPSWLTLSMPCLPEGQSRHCSTCFVMH